MSCTQEQLAWNVSFHICSSTKGILAAGSIFPAYRQLRLSPQRSEMVLGLICPETAHKKMCWRKRASPGGPDPLPVLTYGAPMTPVAFVDRYLTAKFHSQTVYFTVRIILWGKNWCSSPLFQSSLKQILGLSFSSIYSCDYAEWSRDEADQQLPSPGAQSCESHPAAPGLCSAETVPPCAPGLASHKPDTGWGVQDPHHTALG